MIPSLAVYGNLTIDDLVFSDGSTRWAVPGGSAAYAALGMSVWSEYASIVAPVGSNYPVESLGGRVDLSRCPSVPVTLRNWGLYEEDGQRHFVSRSAARNWAQFCPTPTNVRSAHQTAAHIAPMPHEIAIELSKELRKAGTLTISLDLDDHDLIGRKVSLDEMTALLKDVDLFLPSQQDGAAIFPGAEPLEVLRGLRAFAPNVSLIAVKCGADGVIAHSASSREWVHIPAVPVELVDETGAGDSFCGGVLAGYAKDKDPIEALLSGTVSASFCVEGLGLTGLIAATKQKANARLTALREKVGFQSM